MTSIEDKLSTSLEELKSNFAIVQSQQLTSIEKRAHERYEEVRAKCLENLTKQKSLEKRLKDMKNKQEKLTERFMLCRNIIIQFEEFQRIGIINKQMKHKIDSENGNEKQGSGESTLHQTNEQNT